MKKKLSRKKRSKRSRQYRRETNIIYKILKYLATYKRSGFILSLLEHYRKYKNLSRKQLEALYDIADKCEDISDKWLATLEAEIKLKPIRNKSELPTPTPLYSKDESIGKLIEEILKKAPQHKRALFIKSKYEHNDVMTAQELDELKRFHRLLNKDDSVN